MGGLTRDGTTEPVSRDQILRRERGKVKIKFPVQATMSMTMSMISNHTRLIHTLLQMMTIHTYIHVSKTALSL